MQILKDIIAKGDIKIVGLISNSPQFMKLMQTAVLKIDPKNQYQKKVKINFLMISKSLVINMLFLYLR